MNSKKQMAKQNDVTVSPLASPINSNKHQKDDIYEAVLLSDKMVVCYRFGIGNNSKI